ncbi:hypothetical protein A8C56_02625 [Niabella ginsenosidivorans]|uniref:Carrier domain-containing protein n=1 Tax=Niabella ginsenosidivorans TaxID=1176587 RepID=A0A1A9HZW3_9BACT|nr:amino acid adenylation domain-containing protein [Niabella ginsenosidivorans]ANH80020.1 hypothetical protein A8C56_02625 [Niabella ginsenosidivorans]
MDEINKTIDLNNTFSAYPNEKALGELLTEQVKKHPHHIALKFKESVFSYELLHTRVNQLARLLVDSGIQVGDKIGLSLDRSAEMVICFLAVLKAGAAYVPLDPGFPAERLKYMLEDSAAKALITSKKLNSFSGASQQVIYTEDAFAEIDKYEAGDLAVGVGGNDLAYILYTSGSTGKPKGVQIEHHSLINLLLSMQKAPGMKQGDVLLSVTTISFDIFELELYLPLLCGGTLIIADKDVSRDGRKILDIVRNEKVTVLQATPYTWKMLLESGWDEYLPLKALCGGEALSQKLASQLLPKCAELWNMYGPTETTIWSTVKKIEDAVVPITIGKPIDNTTVYILNDRLQLQEAGETGEICIGGEGVARGYLNRPELNGEKFIEDTFGSVAGKKLYRTGDLGKLTAEGEIICLGRMDHQIKIRGFRIETEEIEASLTQLDNIVDAVVILHTDAVGNQRLVAYVTNETEIEATELKTYIHNWEQKLSNSLPEYMLPQAYVPLLRFPQTPNGKIDKKALPEPVFKSDLTEYEAAVTDTEKSLVDIWQKYLGIEQPGIDDDFFDLGGHSIIAVQIMVQIEKQMGRLLPISAFFKHPTIRMLARVIDGNETDEDWKSLVRIKAGTKPPLYIVHGIGLNVLIFHDLAKYLDPEQPVFGFQALGLDGKDEPLDDFKEIAAFYIKEMLEQNPDGPYNLLGYSMGGIIALEMAKQLRGMGKKVTMLGMLDTNLREHDGDHKPAILFNKIKRQFSKALFIGKSLFIHPLRTINYQLLVMKRKFQYIFSRKPPLRPELPNDDIPEYMEQIIAGLERGMMNYRVEPYNGKIFLFKAKERVYYVDDSKYLGWKKYAKGGIIIKHVPGDHKVLLHPPNVIEFAKVMQQVLNKL